MSARTPATAERRLTEQEAPACHDHAGILGAHFGPEHGIQGEHRRGQQGKRDARRADRRIQRIDQDKDAEAFQHQRHDVLAQDLRAQDEPGENEHEHGIAAEQDGDDRGVRVLHGELIQGHADHNPQKAEPGQFNEAQAVDPDTALPEHPPGERDEDKAADEKPREVQLDRIKQSGNFLERDFHRAEKQRCQCNKQVTSFHNGISPYCKTGVPSRDGHSGRTPPQRGRLLPPVRTLRPFMRKMKYTHEKHAIKLMIRSAWTTLFPRLLTSGLFSFFSGQATYEGMARV